MKKTLATTLVGLTLILQAYGQTNSKAKFETKVGSTYANEVYRFNATIPDNWHLYGQIKNDTLKKMAIVDWGLPKIYSELEKTEIENSISIKAYHKPDISSVHKLITAEYLRVNPIQTAMEIDKSNPDARLIYTTMPNGLKYQGKSYFVYKMELGMLLILWRPLGLTTRILSCLKNFIIM